MKKALILDTNFIIENRKELESLKEKLSEVAEIFIPKIVIDEIKSQKSRQLEDGYNKINELLLQFKYYFSYTENFKLNEAKKFREEGIEKYLKKYCDNNIIEYDNKMFEDIVNRALYRIAPFINDINSSDKGFKDALLWCSILRNKKLQKFKDCILVSSDKNAFLKNEKKLIEEYYNTTKKQLKILNNNINGLLEYFGIKNVETKKQNVLSFKQIDNFDQLKESLTKNIEELIYYKEYDLFDDTEYLEKTFTIHQKVNEKDIINFFECLTVYIEEHIFFDTIDVTEIFNKIGISSKNHYNIKLQTLIDLNDIYISISTNESIRTPFLTYIGSKLNSLYKYVPDNTDPFLTYKNKENIQIDNDFIL